MLTWDYICNRISSIIIAYMQLWYLIFGYINWLAYLFSVSHIEFERQLTSTPTLDRNDDIMPFFVDTGCTRIVLVTISCARQNDIYSKGTLYLYYLINGCTTRYNIWGDRRSQSKCCFHACLTVTGISRTATQHEVVIKWKHFPGYWPFVSPVNSPH